MRRLFYLTLSLLLAAVVLPSVAHAATQPVPINPTQILTDSGPMVDGYCATNPVVTVATDGDPITIHMPPGPDFVVGAVPAAWWRTPPSADLVWQLSFRGLLWLQPVAYYTDLNSQTASYATAVDQAITFYAQDPDPGVPSTGGYGNSTAYGWDEGTSLRRLTTLNCLYSRHADTRLVPLMQKEINVQVCPRYYGPPCNAIHNHGMMANEAIYRAGVLTNNAAWKNQAATRMGAEAPYVFDSYGIMKEQSSGYQNDNVFGWTWGGDLIRPEYPTQAVAIDVAVARGTKALRWMTQPDGRYAQIGGTSPDIPGTTSPNPATASLIDDNYGWAFGRWDWTSPTSMYYVLRYGPGRAYHGLQDRPGLTWSDWGNRILVEPGPYGSDPADPFVAYQTALTSQNIAIPSAITQVNKNVTRATSAIYSTSHAYSFTDPSWPGRPHTRYIALYGKGIPSHKAYIRDTFTNDPTKTVTNNYIRQFWHLDPTWTLASQSTNKAVFNAANGRTLTMTTTGLISSIQRGVTTTPVHGWHMPNTGVKLPALEICLRKPPGATTTILETTWVVS